MVEVVEGENEEETPRVSLNPHLSCRRPVAGPVPPGQAPGLEIISPLLYFLYGKVF
jgi:hypothetical protein